VYIRDIFICTQLLLEKKRKRESLQNFYNEISFNILPVRQVTVVVVADWTTHGTPPMLTVFLSVPLSQPVHVMVTAVPPTPVVGLIEMISGVLASSYVNPHWSPLQEDRKPFTRMLS